MLQIDRELSQHLLERAQSLLADIDRTPLESRLQDLEQQTLQPNFWQTASAQNVMQELADLQSRLTQLDTITTTQQDLVALQELLSEENTHNPEEQAELEKELQHHLRLLKKQLDAVELRQFLSGPYDHLGAIVSIHSGQGGTEAMDWADMVRRMYIRYFERNGWKYSLTSESRGEEAGIKAASYEITAPHAYGYLKGEAGTHRLVRLSPFNADSLRQTSFALVEVMPLIETNNTQIVVRDEELEWKFTRAGGAGGQHVNKVSSAVELTHLPTGIVVKCREERSQQQNKERALKLLKAQLALREEEKRQHELATLKGTHTHASWGNQIRNYVLHPYQLVKDTRTNVETSDTTGVLDGDLDQFILEEIRVL